MTTVPGWPDYRKSSCSGETNCVAVDRTHTTVRDTKNMTGGALQVTHLGASLTAIKSGRLDQV